MQIKSMDVEQIINPPSTQYEHRFHNPFEIEDLEGSLLCHFSGTENNLHFHPFGPLALDKCAKNSVKL